MKYILQCTESDNIPMWNNRYVISSTNDGSSFDVTGQYPNDAIRLNLAQCFYYLKNNKKYNPGWSFKILVLE